MQHEPGKPFHRTTLLRRRKAAEAGAHYHWKGRGRARFSEARQEELLAYAGAMLSMVLEQGHCDYFLLKRYPSLKDFRPGDSMAPEFYPTRPEVRRKLEKSGLNPYLLAIAACIACKPNLKTRTLVVPPEKASVSAKLREAYGVETAKIYEREFWEEFEKTGRVPEWFAAILNDTAAHDTLYYQGLAAQRESSAGASPTKIIPGLSRRMLCHYQNQPPMAKAQRLVSQILGDKKPKGAFTGSFTTIRPDLTRKLAKPTPLDSASRSSSRRRPAR